MKRLVPVVVALVLSLAAPLAHAAEPTKPAAPAPAVVSDSLAILERLVARDSTKFDNLYRLGLMYLDREKNTEAAQVFLKANKLRPKDVKTMVNLGIAFIALDIIATYIRLIGSMGRTGVMFLISGVFLIVFGIYLEKKRRRLMAQIKTSAPERSAP